MSEEKESLIEICKKIREGQQAIMEDLKTIIENQHVIFKQVGGKIPKEPKEEEEEE
jgi:hypothetical protein